MLQGCTISALCLRRLERPHEGARTYRIEVAGPIHRAVPPSRQTPPAARRVWVGVSAGPACRVRTCQPGVDLAALDLRRRQPMHVRRLDPERLCAQPHFCRHIVLPGVAVRYARRVQRSRLVSPDRAGLRRLECVHDGRMCLLVASLAMLVLERSFRHDLQRQQCLYCG